MSVQQFTAPDALGAAEACARHIFSLLEAALAIRDRATLASIAQGRPGYALGLDATKRMSWIGLTPSYLDERFTRYLARSYPTDRSLER